MRRYVSLLIVLSVIVCIPAYGQVKNLVFSNQAEMDLFTHWDSTRTLDRDIFDCLLLAEGTPDQIPQCREWLAALETDVAKSIRKDASLLGKGEKLFTFVHDRVLRKYSGTASASSLMKTGEYSCVTATALYYRLGTIIDVPVIFHATPYHVCPVIDRNGTKTWIEMTQPRGGFDVEYDRSKVVELMLESKLTTKEEVEKKGEDAVFDEFILGHFQNSIASILGYHYYNFGLKLDRVGKREEAFWAFAKARALEQEDEAIKKVLDASFGIVSSLTKTSTPYFKAACFYFASRGNDTTIVVDALADVTRGFENLVQNQRDLAQADSILLVVEKTLPPSPFTEKTLREMRQSMNVNKGLALYRKGKYQESFEVVSAELAKDSANGKLQDVYVDIVLTYLDKLLNTGKDDLAIAVVDSAYRRVPEYTKIRDAYARVLASSVMVSGKYRTSPVKARESLLKAFEMDSTNTYVCEALGSVHHELAMAEIRKGSWRSAKAYVVEGLKFSPANEYLKSDLELLNKESPKTKK